MILGTRGSALALAQVDLVAAALRAAHPGVTVTREIIHTTGDIRQDLRLGRPDSGADKGVWTKELEAALADGRIQAAVHSAKDVPTELPPGFRLVACLPRAAVNDVIVTKAPGGFSILPEGAVVATSSVRRTRQLSRHRPDLRVVEIRGNVPTRLQKLADDSALQALVLAQAGLDRLGYATPWIHEAAAPAISDERRLPAGLHAALLPAVDFLPAAAQGIVVIEVFGDDDVRDRFLGAITDAPTWQALRAEREFLRLLRAGCHTPIGLLSEVGASRLSMRAMVFADDDASSDPPRIAQATGRSDCPDEVAAKLFSGLTFAPR